MCKLHCSIYEALLFQYSITLKIKGIGNNTISGNKDYFLNKLKDVFINGIHQDIIHHIYNLNQTDNLIELIFDDDITYCSGMFSECNNITEIDLSNFDTSKFQSMYSMFSNCSSLTSLNLSNFDTSQVKSMDYMFSNCSSLTTLNLSNFDTSKVKSMDYMFSNCSSLTTLNLSNFDTSKVQSMDYMFSDCYSLEYINLKSFNEKNLVGFLSMFYNVPNNIVICINENITNQKIFPQIKNKTCSIIDCTDNWKSKQKKLISNKDNECIEKCINNSLYKYEYNGKCYGNCTYNYYLNNENNYYCTINSSCPNEYPILNEKTHECIKTDIMKIIDNYINDRNNKEKNEIEYYDNILKLIENKFTENYGTSIIDNGHDEIVETDKMSITLTTVQNQKNNINQNITKINLGECESLLRNYYNISKI